MEDFSQLLQQDPKRRLSTIDELRCHDYLSDVNWEAVEKREVQPLFVPPVNIQTYNIVNK